MLIKDMISDSWKSSHRRNMFNGKSITKKKLCHVFNELIFMSSAKHISYSNMREKNRKENAELENIVFYLAVLVLQFVCSVIFIFYFHSKKN